MDRDHQINATMNAPDNAPRASADDRTPESRASSPAVEDVPAPVLTIEATAEIPGLRRVIIATPEPQIPENRATSGDTAEDIISEAEAETLENSERPSNDSDDLDKEIETAPDSGEPAPFHELDQDSDSERPFILIRRVPAQGETPSPRSEAPAPEASSEDWYEDFTAIEPPTISEESSETIETESGTLWNASEEPRNAHALQESQDFPHDYTDRITVPAGFGLPPILESPLTDDEDSDDDAITIDAGLKENSPDAAHGIVHHGAYADSDLKSDEPIEIRRVMSLVEAVVQEQKQRSQDPLNLQADRPAVVEPKLASESQKTSQESNTEAGKAAEDSKNIAEKVFRLPFGLDQQWERHQARVRKLSQESDSKFEAWLHFPFELKPLPRNFAQQSESRQRSIRKLWRLEAETSGLMLTSGLLYLILSIIWLLLPAHFLSIFKAQAAGQFIYQILEAGLVLLLPLTLFARYQPYPLSRIFGPVMPSFNQNLTSFLIGIPLGVLIVSLQNLSTVIFPDVYSSNLLRFMYMPRSFRPGSEVIHWLLIILLPSLLEELFFRGNLFTGLYRQGYKIGAFAVTSLLYALLQQDPFLYIPFLFALILCFVRNFSASLFSSILSHLGFRITIFFLYRSYPIFVRSIPLSTQASQAAIYASAVSLVVSVAVLISLLTFLRSLKSPMQQAEFANLRKPRRALLKNAGLRIGLLLYLLSFLIRLAANN